MALLAIRFNFSPILKTGFSSLLNGLLAWTVLSAIALPLQLDYWPPAVFLTYIPRPLYIGLGFLLGLCFWLQKRHLKLGIATFAIALCTYSLGWGGGLTTQPSSATAPSLTLLSMNIHEQPKALAEFMKNQGLQPDILCLQEVSKSVSLAAAQEAMPDYEFYWGDKGIPTQPPAGATFTSLTGLSKSSFKTDSVTIEPSITGYRTFAVTAQLKAQQKLSKDEPNIKLAQQPSQIAIANVHTTKALVFHAGIPGFITQTPAKAARHINERKQLETWAAAQRIPVIAAGDFNAPYGAVGARLAGFHSSHRQVGKGPLLTFPTQLPLLGIDHIQGNTQIQFHSSLVLGPDFSDHLPQLAYFSLTTS